MSMSFNVHRVQRSISILYTILVVIITIICGVSLNHISIHSREVLENQLQYVNGLVVRSTSEILNHHESLMTLMGCKIMRVNLHSKSKLKHTQKALERTTDLNPSIIALGIASIDGQLLVVTNTDNDDLPNLYEIKEAKLTFTKTFSADGLLIGNTYFVDFLNQGKGEWIVPLRLRVMHNDDNPADIYYQGGIIIALGISTSAHITDWGSIGEVKDIDIRVYKADGTLQFSNLKNIPNDELFGHVDILPSALVRFPESKLTSIPLPHTEINQLSIISYSAEFDLFTIVSVHPKELLAARIDELITLSILYFGSIIVFSMLYWWLARITKLHEEKLVYQAKYDGLTGFPNRYYLLEELNNRIHNAKKHHGQLAVLYIDLDDFKQVNDTYSHAIGDQVLQEAAHRFRSVMREKDFVARFGGDEFIIITDQFDNNWDSFINNQREEIDVINLAKRIQSSLKEIFVLKDCEDIKLYSNASIGIALYPDSAANAKDLIRRADLAMYEAKHSGKNQYKMYTSNIESKVKNHYEIGTALREAITDNELFMVYQPQYDLRTKEIVGIEALVRWPNSKFGPISPGVFVPIAEQHGLVHDLGAYVIDQTISDFAYLYAKCIETGTAPAKLAINVSPLQFGDPKLIDILAEALVSYDVPAKYVEIEITESAMVSDEQEIKRVSELVSIGLTIAIDDFGTGYSSLSKLNSLPISTIKIDQSFIQNMLIDERSKSLVTSIISIGESLGMCIVAEGVETQAQIDFLSEYDARIIIQGYVYSKPVSLDKLVGICNSSRRKNRIVTANKKL